MGAEGGDDVGGGEAGAEVGNPRVELLLERGSGSRVRVRVRFWGFGVLGGGGEMGEERRAREIVFLLCCIFRKWRVSTFK